MLQTPSYPNRYNALQITPAAQKVIDNLRARLKSAHNKIDSLMAINITFRPVNSKIRVFPSAPAGALSMDKLRVVRLEKTVKELEHQLDQKETFIYQITEWLEESEPAVYASLKDVLYDRNWCLDCGKHTDNCDCSEDEEEEEAEIVEEVVNKKRKTADEPVAVQKKAKSTTEESEDDEDDEDYEPATPSEKKAKQSEDESSDDDEQKPDVVAIARASGVFRKY